MFEADLMTAALRPYQMASRRIRLIIRPAYRSTFALIALSTFRRTFRDRRFRLGRNSQGTPQRQRYQTGHS